MVLIISPHPCLTYSMLSLVCIEDNKDKIAIKGGRNNHDDPVIGLRLSFKLRKAASGMYEKDN
ncbi:hypothetical protein HMSSN036_55740 [Paenibacillus macerans]|nr:hypothetical protein HMSSN036_55740 [Paenibacillus macerans]